MNMSNNKPQQCSSTITPITLPADDTDRMHSMHAALSSLDAMTSSFDSTMDSILQTTTTSNHRQRVKDLECRIAEFRELLSRLDDLAKTKLNEGESVDDKICMVFSPNSYESALEGMESELALIRDEISTSTLTRSAADNAIKIDIQKDIDNDDGQALPSDSWLDQMDNEVVNSLKQSNDQRSIPMLLDDSVRKGEEEYQYVLDKLLNSSGTSTASRLGSSGIQKGDDESIYSVTSQLSAISITSNSTRMTAGQRKRHKQQQQQMQNTAKTSSTMSMQATTLSPHLEEETSTTIAGRQQAIAGSSPYLCDNLHDSYGIGTEPSKGLIDCSGFSARGTKEGGTSFYPPSSHVSDLYVFNTAKKSHGVSKKSS